MNAGRLGNWWQRFTSQEQSPLWLLPLVILLYVGLSFSHGAIFPVSKFAFYNYLADAFLHGQLHLRLMPPSTNDLVLYQGRYYLYWPPLPAVPLMPLVAIFGVGVSDALYTVVLGVLNVAAVALVLQQAARVGVIELSSFQLRLLVFFFALGTVHLTLIPYGMVWPVGQLFGFLCLALAYLAALRLRGWPAFFLAGLGIGCALLTRNHLFLAGLWPAVYLLHQHRAAGWKRLVGYALAGLLPVFLAVALTGLYNAARFGSPLNNGLPYHQMAGVFVEDYQQYGYFNLHYVPINLFYQYIAYPFPLRPETFKGGSLFLLSPLFFAAIWGVVKGRPRWSVWTMLATIFLVNLPIVTLMGTGEIQFGPRYLLDWHLPLLMLTALGMRRWPNWLLVVLTMASVLQYVIGATALGGHWP